jgi:hypothetical protein
LYWKARHNKDNGQQKYADTAVGGAIGNLRLQPKKCRAAAAADT